MTKQSLPNEPTFFLNFNKESIEPLIDAIVSRYEIDRDELEYLTTSAVGFPADRILFWRPEFSQFHYICAHDTFLNFNYLTHDEPRIEVLRVGSDELEYVYADRINTDILQEFDIAHRGQHSKLL